MNTGGTVSVLKELQTSNRFILKRLNDFVNKNGQAVSSTNTQSCCQQKDNREEIDTLRARLEILEKKDKETETIVNRLYNLVENLQKQVEELKGEQFVHETTSPTSVIPQNKQSKVNSSPSVQSKDDVEKKPTCDPEMAQTASGCSHAERAVASVQPQQRESNTYIDSSLTASKDSPPVRPEADMPKAGTYVPIPTQTGGYRLGTGSPTSQLTATAGAQTSVIRQTRKKYIGGDETVYERMSEMEQIKAGSSGSRELGGAHTVLVVDISASMSENSGWEQIKAFVTTFLNELERVKSKMSEEEHVALVIFGHKLEVLQHLTNNYARLKTLFGEIILGGPSPLFGGISMALAAASGSHVHHIMINGFQVLTRIIILTDGRATETLMSEGPDLTTQQSDDESRSIILARMAELERSPTKIIFVPVGNPDMDFLSTLDMVEGVSLASCFDGKKLARRTMILSQTDMLHIDPSKIEDGDRAYFHELMMEAQAERLKQSLTSGSRSFIETTNPKLPPVGSRVERGPDWKWKNQDGGGPGTVVGHCPGLQVWVHWDNNEDRNVYRYGGEGEFDVLLIDKYRKPNHGTLKVGCLVRPGCHWTGDSNFKENGVIIKKANSQKLHVRWKNGERGDYSYGENGRYEVEPSPENSVTMEKAKTESGSPSDASSSLDLSDLLEAGGLSLGDFSKGFQHFMSTEGGHVLGRGSWREKIDSSSRQRSPVRSTTGTTPAAKKTKNKNKNN